MPWMPNGQEVARGFQKITHINNDPAQGLTLGDSSEKYGFYRVDGVIVFHASSKARQSGGVGRGRAEALRKQLGLSPEQFKELCVCRMTGPQFHQLVREWHERRGSTTEGSA